MAFGIWCPFLTYLARHAKFLFTARISSYKTQICMFFPPLVINYPNNNNVLSIFIFCFLTHPRAPILIFIYTNIYGQLLKKFVLLYLTFYSHFRKI
ncbi:unnamed protein product [Meloidogyne enterolobii]|uniref:Uncharacterized protein n=1 Tax=Meloidogyne enterolobii TaxID=390850 RepID=A0ACB1B409_MELEN